MINHERHTFVNKLKDGMGHDCGLYYETRKKAEDAASSSPNDFSVVAAEQVMKTYVCDECLSQEPKVWVFGIPHKMAGKDLCQSHREKFEKSLR